MADEREERREEEQPTRMPALEWAAAILGFAITFALMGLIGWRALTEPQAAPPAVVVSAGAVRSIGGVYVVEVTARNLSASTAAGVEVEGTLRRGSVTFETSNATFDFVPGDSRRKGGLFFQRDPRGYALELRALGYEEP